MSCDHRSSLATHCFNLEFKNPIGLGAGFDKNAKYLRELETLGFGFVEMGDDSAEKAISQLSGKELNGRALTVNEARPMVKKDFGGGGRQNRGGGRGGYGRY